MNDELYFCCDMCGHQWNWPAVDGVPDRCEACAAMAVVVCDDPDDQEKRSEEVMQEIGGGQSW